MVHRSESELILDSIIFNGRNQEYGAFELRKLYNYHLIRAVFAAIFLFSIFISIPKIVELLYPKVEKEVDYGTVCYFPIIEKIQPQIPQLPLSKVNKITTDKFLTPVIKDDQKVVDEEKPPIVDQLNGKISAMNQKGTESDVLPIDGSANSEVVENEKTDPIVNWAPENPTFNGDGNFADFLGNNIRFPAQAEMNGVSGVVVVEFIIEKDGTISNVKVVKGIGYGCDEEAERVIKSASGLWQPAKNNGIPVRLKKFQPILFKLSAN